MTHTEARTWSRDTARESDQGTLETFAELTLDARANTEARHPWHHDQVTEWARELRRRNQGRAEIRAGIAILARVRQGTPPAPSARHARALDTARRLILHDRAAGIDVRPDRYGHLIATETARAIRESAAA